MKKILLLIAILITPAAANADALTGGVSTVGLGNKVVDANTNAPIAGAQISLPKQNYSTKSDRNGNFNLDANFSGNTIMSVEKDGYKPFSLTIDEHIAAKPMILGIQKSNGKEVVIESAMLHLGDDNYSAGSANSDQFKLKAIGPFYTKTFRMSANTLSLTNFLVIGSIIGIDTAMARSMGQNSIRNSFASPPEVYFNGTKIAEIQLNGDNQKIKLPNSLIRADNINEVTIQTGKNLTQHAYVDYDDIELMNLSIQSE
ncbi:TPA: carboxypeptidase-like regulatory domain-containing protein [Candidatus Scatousia excrementigallinarum]|uniref:Carboxypeptidase-like regulatory domain-containing protein n=1 Tax=Candidatus Scatousia excrementigallinarum TaxID=2840935 RepID=A0A9D1F0Q6_9BACT|nr:carboxypeptidase-like regulatory domain-containing protein [Candidatus Scatousia excrementigallinarum]